MANHRSAAKRARQDLVRRDRNRATTSALRTAIKGFETAVVENNKEAASSALTHAVSAIDRAASKGVLHKNTASRKVSRLTAMANKLG